MLGRDDEIAAMPEADRTRDDWRDLAAFRCAIADKCDEVFDKRQWYILACDAILVIPEAYFDVDKGDWRNLARYQAKYAKTLINEGEEKLKLALIEDAIATLEKSPKLTDECKRDLAKYHYKFADMSSDKSKKLASIKRAIAIYEELSKAVMLARRDIRCLADYHYTLGMILDDNSEVELESYKSAIGLLKAIPPSERLNQDNIDLAISYGNAGMICKKNKTWRLAQSCYENALDEYIFVEVFDKDIYVEIADIYTDLTEMSLSLNKKLFAYAELVFNGSDLDDAENEFLSLHLAILNTSSSQTTVLHRELVKFMRLVIRNIDNPEFPNASVKTWLQDKTALERFSAMLIEAREVCNPTTLMSMVEQSRSFPHAVALQLSHQEKRIEKLEAKVKKLTEENKEVNAENERLKAPAQSPGKAASSPKLF